MAKGHLRLLLNILSHHKMQIKTTVRYYLTPVRMTKIKNTNDTLCWRGCGIRSTLLHCWWKCKLVQSLLKSVWWFLSKLGINLPQDSAILLLGIYPKDAHSYHKDICSTVLNAHRSIICYSQNLEMTYMPLN